MYEEVKEWIADSIDLWEEEKLEWFRIELIPDEFLPQRVIDRNKAAGKKVRRTSSLRELMVSDDRRDGQGVSTSVLTVYRKPLDIDSSKIRKNRDAWRKVAEEIYLTHQNNHKSNFVFVRQMFEENKVLFEPLLRRCPKVREILSYVLEDRFGFRVRKIDYTKDISDWGEEECQRCGCSLATLLRKRKTGEAAIDAWRLHYVQLNQLLKEVEGERRREKKRKKRRASDDGQTRFLYVLHDFFLRLGFYDFMVVIANNTLRDTIYGMILRVSVGAVLSIVDAATDIYVITSYYESEELQSQANALLCT